MTLNFPYNKFPSHPTEAYPDNFIYAPTLDVKLINQKNRKETTYHSLVDSGADFTCFHGLIGEFLDLKVREGKKCLLVVWLVMVGIAHVHPIVVEVDGIGGEVAVGFSYDLTTPIQGFLGQRGFFELFKVTFNYPNGSFILRFLGYTG